MTKTPTLADGESFVAGRSQETAADLVKRAEEAGLKGTVRTTYAGYIVPSSILEDAERSDDKDVDPDVLAQLEAEKAAAAAAAAEDTDAEDTEVTPVPEAVGDDSVPDPEEEPVTEFDPSAATVDEVKEYLDGVDETERQRVLDAETAGKGRKGILDLAVTPEGAK